MEAPLARSKVQSRFWPVLAKQAWPAAWSENEVTFSRLSTVSVRLLPTASVGPLSVTGVVKVCPLVPAFTAASWKALSTESDTERATVTEAWSVASVGWPAAEARSEERRVGKEREEGTE